jgi:CRISPR/Cas system endoribonuclease Cas6 (RAMP superfamily)
MREKQLGQQTTRQSQVVMNAAVADITTDQLNQQHIKLQPINTAAQAKEKTSEKKLIIHYTHEKRLESLKRDMHRIYHDVFKNTPVEDLKLIVGTRNRRDARNELIRKRPSQRLLKNKPRRSK